MTKLEVVLLCLDAILARATFESFNVNNIGQFVKFIADLL